MLVVDATTNKLIDSKKLEFVDKLIALRTLGKHWEVIDTIVDYWTAKNPKKYRSFVLEMEKKRGTRLNSHGSNKNKSLRSAVDFPEDIYYLIRKLYTADEMPIDKQFMEQFWKRYPVFRVAETL